MIPTREDDTTRYLVKEKASFIGTGHTSAVTNLLSCSGSGGWGGRGVVLVGEVVRQHHALLRLPGKLGVGPSCLRKNEPDF